METKLDKLVERLLTDIKGMPWSDKGIAPTQLRGSVEFFIRAFQNDAKSILKEKTDGKTTNAKTTS